LAASASLGYITSLGVGPDGDVYIVDNTGSGAAGIRYFAPGGTITTLNSSPTSSANGTAAANFAFTSSYYSQQLELSTAGALYVDDSNGGSASTTTTPNAFTVDDFTTPAILSTATPSISGNFSVGTTLTASDSTVGATNYSYQWYDCTGTTIGTCTAITGATYSSYTVTTNDANNYSYIGVVATAYNRAGAGATALATKAGVPAAGGTAPAVSGASSPNTLIGNVLTTTNGAWSGSSLTYTYQWKDCNSLGTCSNVSSGGTSNSYTVQSADYGNTIEAVVTATNSGGSASQTSSATTVVDGTYDTAVSASSPTAYYKLAEATNSTSAIDASGHGDTGSYWSSITSVGAGNGPFSNAISSSLGYDAAGPQGNVGDWMTATSGLVSGIQTNGVGAIEMWINDSATSSCGAMLVTDDNSGIGVGTPSTWGDELYIGTNGYLYGSLNGNSSTVMTNGTNLCGTGWHYLVITGNSSGQSLYVDGVLKATSSTGPGTPQGDTYNYVGLGYGSGGNTGGWTNTPATTSWYGAPNTQIADTAFYSTMLSACVVATHYNDAEDNSGVGGCSNDLPVNTVAPTVSGTAQQGQVLTATTGTWTNSPTSYTYQWRDCTSSAETSCSNISGATSSAYTLQASDVGSYVAVDVTASNIYGAGTAAQSATTAKVVIPPPANTTAPTVSGYTSYPIMGRALSVSQGTWSNSPTSYGYQWYDCTSNSFGTCIAISGATSSAYTSTSSDWGKILDAVVTATNSTGSTPYSVFTPAVEGSYDADVLGASPTAYYKLAEATGATTAVDTSGNSATGTYSGSPSTSTSVGTGNGPFSDAISTSLGTAFNGSQYITAAPSLVNHMDDNQAGSIEMWFKEPTSDCGQAVPLIGESDASFGGAPQNGWVPVLYIGTDNHVRGGFFLQAMTSSVSVCDGNWHYLVLTGTSSGESLYVGTPATSSAPSTTNGATTSAGMYGSNTGVLASNWIGGMATSSGYTDSETTPTTGVVWEKAPAGVDISDVGFYPTTLSACAVVTHYNDAVDNVYAGGCSNFAPANTTAPTISGTAQQDQPLTTTTGTWSNSPTSYTYQWMDCTGSTGTGCSAISGATSSTYYLQASDVGYYVVSDVTASNTAYGAGTTAQSSNTSAKVGTAPAFAANTPTSITRTYGGVYTPNANAATLVVADVYVTAGYAAQLYINGVQQFSQAIYKNGSTVVVPMSFVVPAGESYQVVNGTPGQSGGPMYTTETTLSGPAVSTPAPATETYGGVYTPNANAPTLVTATVYVTGGYAAQLYINGVAQFPTSGEAIYEGNTAVVYPMTFIVPAGESYEIVNGTPGQNGGAMYVSTATLSGVSVGALTPMTRAYGTAYTPNANAATLVTATVYVSAQTAQLYINGVAQFPAGGYFLYDNGVGVYPITFIVPAGESYEITNNTSGQSTGPMYTTENPL
jgi:hypothetical protein